MRDLFSFVQFSDTHIAPFGSDFDHLHRPAKMLKKAVERVNSLSITPSFLLVTGDLVNDGKESDYLAFQEIMNELQIPWYLMPGNHDCREVMRDVFNDHNYWHDGDYLHFVIDGYPLRIICLDSITPGSSAGSLCPQRINWLKNTLAEDTKTPTLLATHQPPLDVGIALMDKSRIDMGAEDLHAIIRDTENVIGLTCGHLHRPINASWAGKRLNISISTAFHLDMDLSGEERLAVTDEPPGFQVHMCNGKGDWLTHTALVGDFTLHNICGK